MNPVWFICSVACVCLGVFADAPAFFKVLFIACGFQYFLWACDDF